MIYESNNWLLKHRGDAKLPGYLILISKNDTDNLSSLSNSALAEIGLIQATATNVLENKLSAKLVYICRWGHQCGNPIHFHIVPLYDWVEEAYSKDPQWNSIEPDGPVFFTYITRAFIEYENPPAIQGPSIEETISVLTEEFNNYNQSG